MPEKLRVGSVIPVKIEGTRDGSVGVILEVRHNTFGRIFDKHNNYL